MKDKGIFILPQTPIKDLNYSKYIPPILADIISKTTNGNFHYCINILDSFKDRKILLEEYKRNINKLNINYDELWIDNDNIDQLLKNVYTLIQRGYISEITSSIYTCPCKKLEIEENKIKSCNPNNLNFYFKDGIMYSKCCNSICQKREEKILVFIPNNVYKDEIIFLPNYLNSDSKTFETNILNSYITISRKRNTGIQLKYNGNTYNLDIDFLWSTYLANFEEKQKIVISGNKMTYQLFVVGLLNTILNPQEEILLLGTPIILNSNKYLNMSIPPEISKLAIALNTYTNKKEKEFDNGILRKLYKSNEETFNMIYEIVTTPNTNTTNLFEEINYILTNNFNAQKVLKKVKDRRV